MSTNGHGHPAPPILLTIAGFDPSCGAGTAADLKTFAAHGCYGVAAITSLTVQNTQGVESVHNTPSAELRAQLEALAKDCEIAAVKIGMLGKRGNDVLFDGAEIFQLVGDRVKEETPHGTGCTFASAFAAQLAAGRALFEAATLAKAYVTKAIEKGYPVGKGRVPLDHFYRQRIEPPARGIHEVPQHGMHPAAEPAAH